MNASRVLPAVAAAACLAVLTGCGPGTTATAVGTPSGAPAAASSSPQQAKTFGVGVPVGFTTPDGSGTVTVNSAARSSAPDVFGQPPKHGSFLILDLTLAVSKGTATANPFGFTAQDAQSYTYQAAPGVAQQDIDSSNLSAGQTVRGQIAFDVPPGPVTVSWKTPLGQTIATWTIPG